MYTPTVCRCDGNGLRKGERVGIVGSLSRNGDPIYMVEKSSGQVVEAPGYLFGKTGRLMDRVTAGCEPEAQEVF